MVKVSADKLLKAVAYLQKMQKAFDLSKFEKYGQMGVEALRNATPVDTGVTASSWSYKIQNTGSGVEISWDNSNVNNGVKIAVILQYGHGTRNGGYVRGVDYINPALKPIFEQMKKDMEREVTGR